MGTQQKITNTEPLEHQWRPGKIIEQARKLNQLSQQDIADIAGIARGTVLFIENGHRSKGGKRVPLTTTVGTLLKVATVSGADPKAVLQAAGADPRIVAEPSSISIDTTGLSVRDIKLVHSFVDMLKENPNYEQQNKG